MKVQDIDEVRFNGKLPSIAYTDFSKIYLSWILSGGELETARIHEKSHIWLQHQCRLANLFSRLKYVNLHLWNLATDLEIAKYIYSEDDNYNIKKPRSFLSGGITTDLLNDFKGEYAEDFYEELLNKQTLSSLSFDALGNMFSELDIAEQTVVEVSKVVESIARKVKEYKEGIKTKEEKDRLQEKILNFKPLKPSLASEIDSEFRRFKITKVSSYKRPNRQENKDFLFKGRASVRKNAKLTLYVDRSGSFSANKTNVATQRISEILLKYRGRLQNDVIYFNDTLYTEDPRSGSGGTNYKAVFDNILETNPEIAVVITDDDFCIDFTDRLKSKVIVIPVGCSHTVFASKVGAIECI